MHRIRKSSTGKEITYATYDFCFPPTISREGIEYLEYKISRNLKDSLNEP